MVFKALNKLFGVDKQQRDMKQGHASASRNLAAGLEEGTQKREGKVDQALAAMAPFAQSGLDANRLSRAALGLDGREAQAAFFDDFQTDPGHQASVQAGIDGMDRSAAANGLLFSGAQAKDVARYVTDRTMNDAFDKRVNRLLGLQGQGEGLARAEADIHDRFGSDLFNARFGLGQQQAGLDINLANAMANSRQAGFNRLIDTVNAVGNTVAAFKGG